MSPDVFQEVSSKNWFSRIGNAIVGSIVGLLLFIVAIPLLFWNEGRAVTTYRSLKEAQGVVISVSPEAVVAANEDKLVYTTGDAAASGPVEDDALGLSTEALLLSRKAEMYQWVEHKDSKTEKKLGGGEETVTTYRYEKEWSDDAVHSSDFKHPEGHGNPDQWPIESDDFAAPGIHVGAFELDDVLVNELNDFENLEVTASQLSESTRGKFKESNGGLYLGGNPASPQVGDIRITFSIVKPGPVSIVARQAGSTLTSYQTKAGDAVALLESGTQTSAQMFKSAQDTNKVITWLIRAGGFFLMFIGLSMLLKPLSVLADVVPLFGNIVEFGTGLVAFLVALVTALVVIAIAWIAVRPVLGISLLVAAVAAVVVVKKRKKPAAA